MRTASAGPPLTAIAGDAQTAAQIKGRERFEGFVETLGKRLQKGQSFLREIPDDVVPELRDDEATQNLSLATI